MVIFGKSVKSGVNLGTRESFADIGATVLDFFGLDTGKIYGKSFYEEVAK